MPAKNSPKVKPGPKPKTKREPKADPPAAAEEVLDELLDMIPQRYEPEYPIEKLSVHPANPRRGNLSIIEQSMKRLGFYGVVLAQESTGHIVVGNHRYLKAVDMNRRTLPTLLLDVDDETAEFILVTDNRTSDVGSYDETILAEVMSRIAEATPAGLEGSGYTDKDLKRVLERANPDAPDEFPAVDANLFEYVCPSCGYGWTGKPKNEGGPS